MKSSYTTKQDILYCAKKLLLEKGSDSFNMREIAKLNNLALGSIYNYFPSKAELLASTVSLIWFDIFSPLLNEQTYDNFIACVDDLMSVFTNLDAKHNTFLQSHKTYFHKQESSTGHKHMYEFISMLQKRLLKALNNDINVKENIFNEFLTKEILVQMILDLIINQFLKQNNNKQAIIQLLIGFLYE